MAQAHMRLGCEPFEQRNYEPRFANTSLARKEHYLPFS